MFRATNLRQSGEFYTTTVGDVGDNLKVLGVLGGAYPGHSTQHYRDQGISGPGVSAAVLNYITRLLIQVPRHAGTLYLSLKNAFAPLLNLQSRF